MVFVIPKNIAIFFFVITTIAVVLLLGARQKYVASNSLNSVSEIRITARKFEFEPNEIKVKVGTKVKIILTSEDVAHGFSIKEYGISQSIVPGKTTEIEFIANKKGKFIFSCSVPCGEGHFKMQGTLFVE